MPSQFVFWDSVLVPDQAELGDVMGSQKGGSQMEGGMVVDASWVG